jgi:hypothetical protein
MPLIEPGATLRGLAEEASRKHVGFEKVYALQPNTIQLWGEVVSMNNHNRIVVMFVPVQHHCSHSFAPATIFEFNVRRFES